MDARKEARPKHLLSLDLKKYNFKIKFSQKSTNELNLYLCKIKTIFYYILILVLNS